MTLSTLQPWSQVDDDVDAIIPGEPEPTPAAVTMLDRYVQTQPLRLNESSGNMPGLRFPISVRLTFVPLALAAGWTLWGAIHPAGRAAGAMFTAFVLIVSAGVILALAARTHRRVLERMCTTDAASTGLPIQAMPSDLQWLTSTVDACTARLHNELARSAERQRQLGLDLSLAESQRRHAEAIIDSITDPVLVIDAFEQLALSNPAAEEIFGFSRADALRRPASQSIRDTTLLRSIKQVRESAGRAASRRLEHTVGDRSFAISLGHVFGELEAQRAPDGQGVVVVMRDITKDQEVSRMKSEFVSHVSHELRTPLSSIRAYVEMLVDGEASDEETRREYYGIIQASTDRLGRLIDNMLNISRIESGTVRINKEPVAISVVTKEALDMLRPQAEEKGLTLTDELTPVIYRVNADRDMIYQSVLNLLSNAIKYTPSGGKVHLGMYANETDRTLAIDVSDTGVGIPPEDLPRMFEKFFRVEANKNVAKGTGLGLNLVKHIVETVHGGRVTLTSEVGKGSTFGMILPLMD